MVDLFAYLLKSGACLALLYSFYRLALMKDTNFALNRAFLLGSAALSLVLPLLRVTSPFFTTVVRVDALGPREALAPSPPPGGPGWLEVLFVAYAAGAGLLFALFLLRVARLLLMAARCGCERHRGLRVVLCGHPGESFSFFRFVFINKAKVPGGDVDRVLAHELAHVRQWHSVDILLTEILAVIQWFNPFVWPYKRSLRETHEYLADRAVIAQGCSLARYQLLIVEQHVGGQLLELASSFRTSQIKRRINMLSKQETKGLARWKPLLILPLAVVLVLAFAESRTVLPSGPAAIGAPLTAAAPSQEMSDEEMAKALKDKMAKLEEMKKAQSEKMAHLKAKLEETTDPEAKAKIMALMKEHKLKSLELGAQERKIKMKGLEMALSKEGDEAKKAEMAQKLETLKAEAEEYEKKLSEVGQSGKSEDKAMLEKKAKEQKAKEEKAKHAEKK